MLVPMDPQLNCDPKNKMVPMFRVVNIIQSIAVDET